MIGKQILHYKIVEKLGEGGMGIVYLAEDNKLDRKVAIKFLPGHIAGNSEERNRFKTEAKAAAALNHPNLATIHAIEEADDELFIVMEYIEGKELKVIISNPPSSPLGKGGQEGGSMPLQDILSYAIQIAEGLQAAHNNGIVHRDIKSSNIMVTRDGKIKIMDFGLAKVSGSANVTRMGTTLGTVAFMSPEQSRGQNVDLRSDIWSFGVVLYEMLTGKLPFQGDYEQAIMYGILHDQPQPISSHYPEIPPQFEEIIFKCMEKNPEFRYQAISDFIHDINRFKEGEGPETTSRLKTDKVPAINVFKRKWKILITGALIFILLLILSIFWRPGIIDQWIHSESVYQEQHLLVLPLTGMAGDPAQQIFCDGLAEILSSTLSQLEQFHGSLWIVPFSEVRRNNIKSPSEARQSFGVNLAVTGNLQVVKDLARLNLNLVDAKNIRQLNSAVIDVKASALTELQDKSIIKLLEMLRFELNPDMQKALKEGGTTDPLANEFYIKGRGYLQRYEKSENLGDAIRLFSQAVKLDSSYALAYNSLGEAYWKLYELSKDPLLIEKANLNCNIAFKLNDNLAATYVTLGMIHAGTGRYLEATGEFSRALTRNPTDAEAYRGLAKAYEAQGLLNEAEITYKKSIDFKPKYWAGYNALGVFYFKHNRYEEAIDQFKIVISLTPDNSRGYNNLGGVYYLMEKWTEARKMFEKSMSLHKSYSVASNLGTLYFIEGFFTDAARMYEMALEMNDHDYLIWGNLASAYYWIPDKKDRAVEIYRQAIVRAEERRKINPNDPGILANLAGYYAMIGESSIATQLITKALNEAPRNAQIMFEAGTVFEQLGNREKALYWIGRALENGHSRSEIEHQPMLHELLADDRYDKLVREK